MIAFESLASQRMVDVDSPATLTATPEAALSTCGLTLTDAERELAERLRPLLALPADALHPLKVTNSKSAHTMPRPSFCFISSSLIHSYARRS